MRNDQIPSLKEDIDQIHVPFEKLDAIIENVENAKKQRNVRTIYKRFSYSLGAAVIVVGLLVGSAAVSPAMASVLSSVPFIGSVFSHFGDSGQKQIAELGLVDVVEQSETVNGITISLGEIIYDGTRFNISYSIVSDQPIDDSYVTITDSKIDGEFVPGGIGIHTYKNTPTEKIGYFQIEPYWKGEPGPEEMEYKLSFEGKNGEKWSFINNITKKKNEEILVDHALQIDGFIMNVKNVVPGPGGLLLNYEAETWVRASWHLPSYLQFRVEDSSGEELKILEGGMYDEYGKILFEPIDETTDELTITPYFDFPEEKEEWMKPYEDENYKFDSFKVKIPK